VAVEETAMNRLARRASLGGLIFVAASLVFLSRGAAFAGGGGAGGAGAESSAGGAPAGLTCEGMVEPLGMGIAAPRLSWQVTDTRRGAVQTAYEVRVSSSLEKLAKEQGDVWDTGRVESSESLNVAYAGPALASRGRYYWQVRVWDGDGKASAYSKASWWEMGLLAREDWKAQWITRDLPIERGDYASKPKWIWGANEDALAKATVGKRDFRLSFTLSQKPQAAVLLISGKDNLAVWINGKEALAVSPRSKFGRPRDPWGTFHEIAVSDLQAGKNSIAAETTLDKPEWAQAPVVGGFIAMLRVEMPDGTVQRMISNTDWKTIEGQIDSKWTAADFDDAAWPNAGIAAEIGQSALGTPWPAEPISWLGRDFKVSKAVRSARVYSTALGTYQLYLNGARVGDDILAPGWTDYKKRVVYQVYDATRQVRPGANSLEAILGGGWYGDGLGWLQNRYNFGPPPVRLMGQLEIEYVDGTRETIGTDESWKASSSAILKSDIYNGETYDARLEKAKQGAPAATGADWGKVVVAPAPEAAIVAQDYQPIRAHETLAPKNMTNPAPGVYVFDLGQNMVGWARLRVAGNQGTKVQLRFAEVLKPDGDVYTENLRTAEATDTYILRGGGEETFEPHFTFHGFRYIQLTGYPGTPSKNAVEGIAFYTSAPFTMKFHSANATLNQLASNILWGQRGNFLSVPTDCPQRDERLGWMGDAEVFWRTASYNANLEAFSHKFTQDIRDAQSDAGAYADVSPRVGPTGESAAGWGDAGVVIPWSAYMQFGDKTVVQENWAAMEKWMAHLADANPNYLWLKERGNDYGDWVAIGSQTSKDMIATAYWAYDATLMKEMAVSVGKDNDANKYGELFEKIRTAFQRAYVKDDGTVGTGSQTSYALALHMNMLDEKQRPVAAQKLVDDIVAHGYHLTTGFLGTPYLLLELSKTGHSGVAYKLLLQRTYPSWFYMIDHGATTMWERWNGDQKMDDPSMNSFNHYAYGAVAEWLYRYAAGIDEAADGAGFHSIVLHPQFSAELGEVDATYESQRGAIGSHWKVGGGSVTWNVVIPANATAALYFPANVDRAKLSENGKNADQSPALKFVNSDASGTVYQAGAGTYAFRFAQP
jgi:alpha-L-rhamnosidase